MAVSPSPMGSKPGSALNIATPYGRVSAASVSVSFTSAAPGAARYPAKQPANVSHVRRLWPLTP